MSRLEEILKERKRFNAKEGGDWRSIIIEISKEETEKFIAQYEPVITGNIINRLNEKLDDEILRLTKDVKKGDKGEKGDKGDFIIGEKGEKGDKGDKGEAGRDGLNGLDGMPGVNGLDGKNGLNGSPDKPLEIANKLNTLEEKVDMSVIRGLKKILEALRKSIRESKRLGGGGSGGGMGNWVTESVTGTINGVNTVFTISSNVASSGKAIILLYQGQVQEYGNHFTVSGNTITMTFAPETGTSVFAMYVRT